VRAPQPIFPSIANVLAPIPAVFPDVAVIAAKIPSILAQVSPVPVPLALAVVTAQLVAILP
jgi:hypothetical protein